MATIYADTQGALVRTLLSDQEAASFAEAPVEASGEPLHFDHITNPALVADLRTSTDTYRLVDGVLTKDGVVVTITPPAPAPPPAVDSAAIGAALDALPEGQPLTKADLAPLLALFGAGVGQA
jgi:hypothetical protein